ncbi:MAG: hypothetical protein QXO22_06465 [Thermosphaera sp.]
MNIGSNAFLIALNTPPTAPSKYVLMLTTTSVKCGSMASLSAL